MPHRHSHPENSPSREDGGPEVVVGEWRSLSGNHPRDTSVSSEESPSPGNGHAGSVLASERKAPGAVVTAIIVALVLVVGGLGGYLAGRRAHYVSVSGQVSYACALVANVQETHRRAEDWGEILEDQAYSDVAAVSGILRSLVAFSGDRDEFQEFLPLLSGLDRLDPEALTAAVAAMHQVCEDR